MSGSGYYSKKAKAKKAAKKKAALEALLNPQPEFEDPRKPLAERMYSVYKRKLHSANRRRKGTLEIRRQKMITATAEFYKHREGRIKAILHELEMTDPDATEHVPQYKSYVEFIAAQTNFKKTLANPETCDLCGKDEKDLDVKVRVQSFVSDDEIAFDNRCYKCWATAIYKIPRKDRVIKPTHLKKH